MIITEKVKLKVSSATLKHYRNLGYDVPKKFSIIDIDVKDLTKSSIAIVDVECDICKILKQVEYREYLRNISNCGYYTCNNCKRVKCKNTMILKHGKEHSLQIEEFKNKAKNTCFEKYGDEYYRNNEQIKITNLKRYGVEYGFQNEDIKAKIRKTCIDKYGVENISQNEDIKNKKIITFNQKYGVNNPMQNIEILKKVKKTNIERYGCENVSQNDNIINKKCYLYLE